VLRRRLRVPGRTCTCAPKCMVQKTVCKFAVSLFRSSQAVKYRCALHNGMSLSVAAAFLLARACFAVASGGHHSAYFDMHRRALLSRLSMLHHRRTNNNHVKNMKPSQPGRFVAITFATAFGKAIFPMVFSASLAQALWVRCIHLVCKHNLEQLASGVSCTVYSQHRPPFARHHTSLCRSVHPPLA
jgi:hypothetical protein